MPLVKKVLVVEDEPTLREGLRDLLEAAGHRVVAVGDGLDAVDRGLAEPFDVVLLDLMLPRLPGIEVCRRLRTARPALPIVMLTARGAEDEKVAGLAAGVDRNELVKWMTIGVFGLFGVYTVGLALLIEITGI